MTGAYAQNFHEGSRSEILADYLFSSWGTVTPVRRQDDYGIDLYCTLSDRIGQRAVVSDYFVVQVKSGTDPWVFADEGSVKWLVDFPTPLFLACIDKKNGVLRVYHVTPRFYVRAMGRLPNRLVLVPEDVAEGTSVEWTNGEEFSLSAPIIQVNCSDLTSDEQMKSSKQSSNAGCGLIVRIAIWCAMAFSGSACRTHIGQTKSQARELLKSASRYLSPSS